MLLTEQVEMVITSRNAGYYKALGYDIPMKHNDKTGKDVIDVGKKIVVKTNDLPNGSHIRIEYRCDCCGGIFSTEYHDWVSATYPELGDLCKNCASKIKLPKAVKDKYGFDNVANVSSVIKKKKATNLERYGNEWAIASSSVKETIVASIMDRYGVDNAMKSAEVVKKAIKTNNERYGGNSSQCDPDIRAKTIQSCLDKYGVPNAYQSKDIQAKARKTFYKNGTTPSSKAEKEMCNLLVRMYGEDNCYPNYPEGNLSLDCLVVVNGVKIDFEYDGIYWHKGREAKDRARNAVLMNMGYRVVRIKANCVDTMPTMEQIKNAVDYLVKDNHHIVFIDMNE